MSDFDTLLQESIKNEALHGCMMKCVDKNGKVLYGKVAGRTSLDPDSPLLQETALLKVASATKLITSIALLQCIDRDLITLDEPLTDRVIPELHNKPIIREASNDLGYELVPNTTPITARHLLTHTAGLSYRFLHPLIGKWAETSPDYAAESTKVWERYNTPLIFEPGKGWYYGTGLDWAGVVVHRLHPNLSCLGDYFTENIFKPVGVTAPFPTFARSGRESEFLHGVKRSPSGGIEAVPDDLFKFGTCDQEGGAGLTMTMSSYLAVLQDLISDIPKLLSKSMAEKMYEPQFSPDSPALPLLRTFRQAWDLVSGPVKEEDVNHGLGGIVLDGKVDEIKQPKGILAWGGASNIAWFMCREKGIAGFFGTQLLPFGDAKVKEIVNAWKTDFWSQYLE